MLNHRRVKKGSLQRNIKIMWVAVVHLNCKIFGAERHRCRNEFSRGNLQVKCTCRRSLEVFLEFRLCPDYFYTRGSVAILSAHDFLCSLSLGLKRLWALLIKSINLIDPRLCNPSRLIENCVKCSKARFLHLTERQSILAGSNIHERSRTSYDGIGMSVWKRNSASRHQHACLCNQYSTTAPGTALTRKVKKLSRRSSLSPSLDIICSLFVFRLQKSIFYLKKWSF